MKTIQLSQGQVAKVDNHWFDYLNQWKWTARKNRKEGSFYAIRRPYPRIPGTSSSVFMHNVIKPPPAGMQTDHINCDGLDNQECNLRDCTIQQNSGNRRKYNTNTSGFKGVTWHKQRNKWKAAIMFNAKHIHLGLFEKPEQAARAYDTAAVKYFGEFAKLNFPR